MEKVLFHGTGMSTCLLSEEQGKNLKGKFGSVGQSVKSLQSSIIEQGKCCITHVLNTK